MTDAHFVVQEHTTASGVHWDLMIEKGEALTTFRLAEKPENALSHAVEAVRIADHALRFLTWEGPVQRGTGRVRIVERGAYRLLSEEDDSITLDLRGMLLQGGFTLTHSQGATWVLESSGHRP